MAFFAVCKQYWFAVETAVGFSAVMFNVEFLRFCWPLLAKVWLKLVKLILKAFKIFPQKCMPTYLKTDSTVVWLLQWVCNEGAYKYMREIVAIFNWRTFFMRLLWQKINKQIWILRIQTVYSNLVSNDWGLEVNSD